MVVVNLSYLLITGMLNQFGVSVAAASGVGLKINTFAGMPCWAIGQAVTAMAGQNIGAGDTIRVRKTTSTGLCLNLFITLVMVLLVQIFWKAAHSPVHPGKPGSTCGGYCVFKNMLRCEQPGIRGHVYLLIPLPSAQGAATIALFNALLDAVIVRLPVSWLLAFPLGLGYPGIYIGQALSPLLPAAAGLIYFKSKGWENKRILHLHRA